jgi:hypothetical protein
MTAWYESRSTSLHHSILFAVSQRVSGNTKLFSIVALVAMLGLFLDDMQLRHVVQNIPELTSGAGVTKPHCRSLAHGDGNGRSNNLTSSRASMAKVM